MSHLSKSGAAGVSAVPITPDSATILFVYLDIDTKTSLLDC